MGPSVRPGAPTFFARAISSSNWRKSSSHSSGDSAAGLVAGGSDGMGHLSVRGETLGEPLAKRNGQIAGTGSIRARGWKTNTLGAKTDYHVGMLASRHVAPRELLRSRWPNWSHTDGE
jgi:hypothetical protein